MGSIIDTAECLYFPWPTGGVSPKTNDLTSNEGFLNRFIRFEDMHDSKLDIFRHFYRAIEGSLTQWASTAFLGPSEQTETNNNPERSPVLDAGGKPECPEKNLWKQVWTGNQMDIQHRDRESNPGSTAGRKYCYATCFPIFFQINFDDFVTKSITHKITKISKSKTYQFILSNLLLFYWPDSFG